MGRSESFITTSGSNAKVQFIISLFFSLLMTYLVLIMNNDMSVLNCNLKMFVNGINIVLPVNGTFPVSCSSGPHRRGFREGTEEFYATIVNSIQVVSHFGVFMDLSLPFPQEIDSAVSKAKRIYAYQIDCETL